MDQDKRDKADRGAVAGNPDLPQRVIAMREYLTKMRARFGEEVAFELRRTYLTGVNDCVKTLNETGAFMQYALDAEVELPSGEEP